VQIAMSPTEKRTGSTLQGGKGVEKAMVPDKAGKRREKEGKIKGKEVLSAPAIQQEDQLSARAGGGKGKENSV